MFIQSKDKKKLKNVARLIVKTVLKVDQRQYLGDLLIYHKLVFMWSHNVNIWWIIPG